MAIPLIGEIEKLINEHGSAVILKERIELLKDQYAALEQRLAASETAKAELLSQKQAIELDYYKLKDRVTTLEAQLVERHGQRLDAVRESILSALVAFNSHISIGKVAELTQIGEQLALYHLTEMEKGKLVHGSYTVDGRPPTWAIAQGGRGYLVQHGLLT